MSEQTLIERLQALSRHEHSDLSIGDEAAACIAELQDRLAQWEGRKLARNQPCGCVTCNCDSVDQCFGCGAKNCGTTDCVVMAGNGGLNAVWEEHPWSARITELESVVEKLPRTADGVPIVPGTDVWLDDGLIQTGPGEVEAIQTNPEIVVVNDYFKWSDYKPNHEGFSQRPTSTLYSTRSAAESTKERAGE